MLASKLADAMIAAKIAAKVGVFIDPFDGLRSGVDPLLAFREAQDIHSIYLEVSKNTGITEPLKVTPTYLDGDPLNAGVSPYGELVYSIGMSRFMPTEAIKGMVAHELGHIYYRHNTLANLRRRQADIKRTVAEEKQADIFAGERGYAQELIESFKVILKMYAEGKLMSNGPDTHGSDEERISLLQSYISTPKNAVCSAPPCFFKQLPKVVNPARRIRKGAVHVQAVR